MFSIALISSYLALLALHARITNNSYLNYIPEVLFTFLAYSHHKNVDSSFKPEYDAIADHKESGYATDVIVEAASLESVKNV